MKYIKIREREVLFPLHVNEIHWHHVRRLMELEDKKGEVLNYIEVATVILGETVEYWRNQKNSTEILNWLKVLYQIWVNCKLRPMRTGLKTILISEQIIKKPSRLVRFRVWVKKIFSKNGKWIDPLPVDKITFEEKEYEVLPKLDWGTTGQWQDAMELLKYLHEETSLAHRNEIIEKIFKIYAYPSVTGNEYSTENAMAWNIDNARFVDVYDFGTFFLRKLIGFQLGIKTIAHI